MRFPAVFGLENASEAVVLVPPSLLLCWTRVIPVEATSEAA